MFRVWVLVISQLSASEEHHRKVADSDGEQLKQRFKHYKDCKLKLLKTGGNEEVKKILSDPQLKREFSFKG
jgi:hypothetical protein